MRTLLVLLVALPLVARTEPLVLIVHPASGVERLDQEDAVNIFMGRYRKLPSGISAMPIDIGKDSPERRAFYQQLLHKELSAIDSYWARLVYSGATSPPLRAANAATAIDIVADNVAAIAYVRASQVDARVKVVLELHEH